MLRPFILILLIISIFAQSFERLWLVAYLEINHEYIAKELCINRPAKQIKSKRAPINPCNGKCYRMRKMKEQDQKEQKAPLNPKSKEVVLFCETQTTQSIDFQLITNIDKIIFYPVSHYQTPNFRIFHPPTI